MDPRRAHTKTFKITQSLAHTMVRQRGVKRGLAWLLAALAGWLGHLAIAPQPYALAVLCFSVPLFVSIEWTWYQQSANHRTQGKRSRARGLFANRLNGLGTALALASVAGCIAAMLGGEWVVNTAHVYGRLPRSAAWGINLGYGLLQGVEWGILLGGGFWIFRKQRMLRAFALPLTCLLGQWFLPRLLGYTFGQTLSAFPLLLQSADLIGSSGLTWLLLLWHLLLFELLCCWLWPNTHPYKGLPWLVVVAVGTFALTLGYGVRRTQQLKGPHKKPRQATSTLHLAAVQPNFSLGHLASNPALVYSTRRQSLGRLLAQSQGVLSQLPAAKHPIPRVLLWPESVYLAPLHDPVSLLRVRRFALQHNTQIIFPTWRAKAKDIYGVSVHLGTQGQIKGLYHKIALIPFGETIPLGRWLPAWEHWLKRQIPNIGLFTQGTRHSVFALSNTIRAAPLICFDLLDQRITLGMAQNGANLGLVQANLAWFGKSPVSRQFAWYARVRAVEHRMPMALLSQNGQSQGFNALGERNLPLTPHFAPAYWASTLTIPLHGASVYTRIALYMHWALLGLWFLCLAMLRLGGRKSPIRPRTRPRLNEKPA